MKNLNLKLKIVLIATVLVFSSVSIAQASFLSNLVSYFSQSSDVGGGINTINSLPVRNFLGLTDTPSSFSGQGTKVVSVNAGETALEFTTASSFSSPLTTKGDLFSYDSADARLGTGTNGQILSVDTSTATGLKWVTATGTGDMLASTYDPANISEQLVGLTATQSLSNKTITAGVFDTSITGSFLTASEMLISDASKNIVSAPVLTYPSLTELTYVKGLTSSAQTQITAKATKALDNLASVAINTSLISDTDNTDALGSASIGWSDLFLGNGSIITFSSAPSTPDVTLTYSADALTLAGGVFAVPASGLTINSVNVTSTGTQLNYLNAATGTTGTTSTNLVFSTSPTLVTPTLGVASATSINKVAITAPATGSTLTIADGKTLTASNSITLAGTDGKGINVGAATSGKILVGDGSNMVLSTPTFPNASATSGKIIKSDGTNWVASTETYAAPGTNKNVMKSDGTNWTSAAPSFEGLVEAISFEDGGTSIAATTYVLELYAEFAYTINEMRIISASGTTTANLKIGSTSVTSCSAVSVTSTIALCTASGANTVAVGDKITLVTTSNSGLNDLQVTIKTTRN